MHLFGFIEQRAQCAAGIEAGVAGVGEVDNLRGGIGKNIGKRGDIVFNLRGIVRCDKRPGAIGGNLGIIGTEVEADGLVQKVCRQVVRRVKNRLLLGDCLLYTSPCFDFAKIEAAHIGHAGSMI